MAQSTTLRAHNKYLSFKCPTELSPYTCQPSDFKYPGLIVPIEDFDSTASAWTLGYYNELGAANLWICNTNGIELTGTTDKPTQEAQQTYLSFTNPSTTSPVSGCSTVTYTVGSTATTTQVSDVSGTDAYATNGYAGGMNVKWTITFSAGSGAMPQYSNVTSNTADTGAANSGVFTFASLTTLPSIGSMFTLTESSMVQTAVWDNANITIRNFNTQISNLRDVEFGGFWITNWTAPPQTATYNATGITMLLPPEGPTQVDFSVANFNVTKATSFQITLEAADANDFSAYYPIAAPFVSSNIVAQNLGEVTEDVFISISDAFHEPDHF